MKEPNYLVQTADGILHAYWDAYALRISLFENKGEQVKLYKRVNQMGAIRYLPCTEQDVRKDAA